MTLLADLLSPEQLQLVADQLAGVLAAGYGDLTLTVKAGRLRFLRVTRSIELPAPTRGASEGITPSDL